MSDLQHFGVKGMRWGVRKDDFRARQASRVKRGDELNEKKLARTKSVARNSAAGLAGGAAGLTALVAGQHAAVTVTSVAYAGGIAAVTLSTPAWAPVLAVGGAVAGAVALGAAGYKTVSELRAATASNRKVIKDNRKKS